MTAPMEAAPVRLPTFDLTGRDLTAREVEVLDLVSQSLSNVEIARRLSLAEPTVKSHVSRIMTKLGARGREHAVLLGARAGYLLVVPRRALPRPVMPAADRTRARRDALLESEREILRAQAADREACRAALAAIAAQVLELETRLDGEPGSVAESARWALERMRLVVEKAGVPVRVAQSETLEGSK